MSIKLKAAKPKTAKEVDSIDLSKAESDGFNMRISRIQDKINQIQILSLDIQLHKREHGMYINDILKKNDLTGYWRQDGDKLVRMTGEEIDAAKELI